MNTKKNTVFEEHHVTVSEETGVVLEVESRIVKKTSAESFMQVYLEDNSSIYGIDNKSQLRVMRELWVISQFDTNQVILVKSIKEDIAKKVGCTLQTVNNHITKFVKKDLLIKKDTSVYYLNPEYFFKGFLQNRPKVVKSIREYHLLYKEDQPEAKTDK